MKDSSENRTVLFNRCKASASRYFKEYVTQFERTQYELPGGLVELHFEHQEYDAPFHKRTIWMRNRYN